MIVEVQPNLFGMVGNASVFSNEATFTAANAFEYNQPLGGPHQTISIADDILSVDVDFEVTGHRIPSRRILSQSRVTNISETLVQIVKF